MSIFEIIALLTTLAALFLSFKCNKLNSLLRWQNQPGHLLPRKLAKTNWQVLR
jgi:hypothetical protein